MGQVRGGHVPVVHLPRGDLRERPGVQQDGSRAGAQLGAVQHLRQPRAPLAVAHAQVQ